eukprot:gene23233-29435_t
MSSHHWWWLLRYHLFHLTPTLPRKILALGVLLQEAASNLAPFNNSYLNTMWNALGRLSQTHYAYNGSLATPPCTANVQWLKELYILRKAIVTLPHNVVSESGNNNRNPARALNSRPSGGREPTSAGTEPIAVAALMVVCVLSAEVATPPKEPSASVASSSPTRTAGHNDTINSMGSLQNPILATILTKLLKIDETSSSSDSHAAQSDLMVSHDRYTVYRSTVFPEESGVLNGKDFTTGRRNVHLDLNPWWWLEASQDIIVGADSLQYTDPQDFIKENNLVVSSMGNHCQIVMNFLDNREEDGGTLVVPQFHRHLTAWTEQNKQSRRPLPWVEFSPSAEEELLSKAHRVTMRAGSVLIWNQTLAHGTAPNESTHCRMAQYMKAFSRTAAFSQRPLPRSVTELQKTAWKPKNKKKGVSDIIGSTTPTNSVQESTKSSVESLAGAMSVTDLSFDSRSLLSDTTSTSSSSSSSSSSSDVNPRLLRRASALRQLLEEHGALEVLSPLGRHLFGLDVLGDVANSQ